MAQERVIARRLERGRGSLSTIPPTLLDREGNVSIRAHQLSIKRAVRAHAIVLPDDQSDSQRSNRRRRRRRPTIAWRVATCTHVRARNRPGQVPPSQRTTDMGRASCGLRGRRCAAGGDGSDRSSSSSCAPHEGLLPCADDDSRRIFRHAQPWFRSALRCSRCLRGSIREYRRSADR